MPLSQGITCSSKMNKIPQGALSPSRKNEWQTLDPETGLVFPWFVRPFLDVLKTWDITNWDIFEYGCGFSTLWFASAVFRSRPVIAKNTPTNAVTPATKTVSQPHHHTAGCKNSKVTRTNPYMPADLIMMDETRAWTFVGR